MEPPPEPDRDPQARFDRLFERHGAEIFRFFTRKGFAFEESAELTQDTFVRVYQGLREFRGESKARTWIFSIARNLYLNARRHERAAKRQGTEIRLDELQPPDEEGPGTAGPLPDPSAPDPLGDALERERRERLWRAVEALPPRMRRCVVLRVGQERKYREIADLLGVSIDTVKSQLHQARGRLHESLADEFEGLDGLGGET